MRYRLTDHSVGGVFRTYRHLVDSLQHRLRHLDSVPTQPLVKPRHQRMVDLQRQQVDIGQRSFKLGRRWQVGLEVMRQTVKDAVPGDRHEVWRVARVLARNGGRAGVDGPGLRRRESGVRRSLLTKRRNGKQQR